MKLRLVLVVVCSFALYGTTNLLGQLIDEQKKAVAFVFGETHPKANGAPILGPTDSQP